MRLEINKKLQNQEVNNLKRENVSLKVFIFFLVILICSLCIEIWELELVNNKKEFSSKMIMKEDESKKFMSINFIELEENNK